MIILISQVGYILITIAIVVVLIFVFAISLYLYKKTPEPTGGRVKKSEACKTCSMSSCSFRVEEKTKGNNPDE